MSETQERLHAIVHGLVQGVSFRHYTTQKARQLVLTGWVMNRSDGRSVEVVAEGSRNNLNKLRDWLHRGPSSAVVERVESEWQSATGEFESFQIRYWHGRSQDDARDDPQWE